MQRRRPQAKANQSCSVKIRHESRAEWLGMNHRSRPLSRIAYLVNQYPKTRHCFIHRESRALEALGLELDRYSIRSTEGGHVDPSDAEEAARTKVILSEPSNLATSVARKTARVPLQFAKAAKIAYEYAKVSGRGSLSHDAHLTEASVLRDAMVARNTTHVHAHFGTNSAVVAHLAHVLGGHAFSFTVHGPEEFDRVAVLALGSTIQAAKFLAAVSEYGRSQLCRQVPREDWHKITVVRGGLERDLLSRVQPRITNAPKLVCIGRLHEQKGQLVLLDALVSLKQRGIRCEVVLAGDGPMREELEH